MNFRFRSHQRLKNDRLISHVFENGKKFHSYPLLFIYAPLPHDFAVNHPFRDDDKGRIQIGFSVPKKKFRKAVDRNRIKRLMREAYRLQQHNHSDLSSQSLGVMALYIGHAIPEYTTVYKAMGRFMEQL